MLAGMFHSIGVSMGDQFLESDQFNPNGYFEDADFLGINKGILEHAGGTWFAPPSIEEIRKVEKFDNAITRTVQRKQKEAGKGFWGWKDPRNCLTCWLYLPVIQKAKFIIIVRRISDIKKSLNKTHGTIANWDNLIDMYYTSLNEFLLICPNKALTVSFEEIVYEKYAREKVPEILRFIGKPESLQNVAMKTVRFR